MEQDVIFERASELVVGSVIPVPVQFNGLTLCSAGTIVSEQLKKLLPKFNINRVPILQMVNNVVCKSDLHLPDLDPEVYKSIRALDTNGIILCAKTLVSSVEHGNSLVAILREYDEATYIHSVNVASLAVLVGIKDNMSIDDLYSLALGSLLHDIGKLTVPLRILNKPGKLTEEEMAIVRKHPQCGYRILCGSSGISQTVKQIVLQHHENHDGTGYPMQLSGDDVNFLAKVVHVCDVYEALCVKRSYKNPMPRNIVRDMVIKDSGKMFESDVVDNFFKCVPLYLLGETVTQGTLVGSITDDTNPTNPTVCCNGMKLGLDQFESKGSDGYVTSYNIT